MSLDQDKPDHLYQYNIKIEFEVKGDPRPKLPMSIKTNELKIYTDFLEESIAEMKARLSECNQGSAIEVTITKDNQEKIQFTSCQFPHQKLAQEYQTEIEKTLDKLIETMDLDDYLHDAPNYRLYPLTSPRVSIIAHRPKTLWRQAVNAFAASTNLWEVSSGSSAAASQTKNKSIALNDSEYKQTGLTDS